MVELDAKHLGAFLKSARLSVRMTQVQLAQRAQLPRLRLVRAELGRYVLTIAEAARVAAALKVPLERLLSGRWRPPGDLQGVAIELYRLGIRDLEVAAARVPGAFRRPEEIVATALTGDQPEPRVVEAVPSILARRRLNVLLTVAFADALDARVRTRLAWLSDITLALSTSHRFPIPLRSPEQLRQFLREGTKGAVSDSLGHPGDGPLPLLWERWNITYAGTLDDFLRRTQEVQEAYLQSELNPESEE